MKKTGQIIKQQSNLYTIQYLDKKYECRARGKFRNDKLTPLVGEFVVFDDETNYILELLPRKNSLNRPPIANVDEAIIMTSVKKPNLSLSLLDKQLVCVMHENIEPIVCLSKCDLLDKSEMREVNQIFKYYKSIGIKVITNKNLFKLKRLIKGKTVVLTGQTGSGKSSLINRLDKNLNLETNEISEALGRGVHTTRHTELHKVGSALIADTPGFSALDLNIDKNELKKYFIEFRNAKCKFDNCMHINEKDCQIKKLVQEGKISKTRYENYVRFWGEL